jgi:hypothetical protein
LRFGALSSCGLRWTSSNFGRMSLRKAPAPLAARSEKSVRRFLPLSFTPVRRDSPPRSPWQNGHAERLIATG